MKKEPTPSAELQKFLAILDTIPHGTIPVEITGDALCSLRGYIRTLQAKLEASEKENAKMPEISKQDLLILKDLRDICIDDDLLDLDSYDSFARADKISNAWKALRVIDKLLSLLTP